MSLYRFILHISVTIFLLTRFVSAESQLRVEPISELNLISDDLKTWNEAQRIKLQPHQLRPIDYLVNKKPNQKGLLINHYLGTGKTYLAIGFAERYPTSTIVILAPHFLEGHWLSSLDSYSVKDKKRYRFVGHNTPAALVKEDLSNTIVILDESHKLIESVCSQDTVLEYKELYMNLRKAHKILSLSGTPIYTDSVDLAYQINLVSGENKLSFNEETFRKSVTSIDRFKMYWRGHLLESQSLPLVLQYAVPFAIAPFLITSVNPVIETSLALVLQLLFLPVWALTKWSLPALRESPIRLFNPSKLEKLISEYVSYYNFEHDTRYYPSISFHTTELSYNNAQFDFLFKFLDSELNHDQLVEVLKDTYESSKKDVMTHKENILLNSTRIQDSIKKRIGAGREIGNLSFIKQSNLTDSGKFQAQDIIFPEKFYKILENIESGSGPAVVYSHYNLKGLERFQDFLDIVGYQGKYRVFHVNMPAEEQKKIIDEFNNNKVKLLLLHPDITEGISLKGVRQFHFLEPSISRSLQKQLIGRCVRYQSHAHLPEEERHVAVHEYIYKFLWFDLSTHLALRENWHHNFSELNYYGERIQVDKNTYLKVSSPDTLAKIHLNNISKQMEVFKNYVNRFSIENSYCREVQT